VKVVIEVEVVRIKMHQGSVVVEALQLGEIKPSESTQAILPQHW